MRSFIVGLPASILLWTTRSVLKLIVSIVVKIDRKLWQVFEPFDSFDSFDSKGRLLSSYR